MYPQKPPAWKNVQGRPKSATVSSVNKKPHASKYSKKNSISLERDLPFIVGQVYIIKITLESWEISFCHC